MSIESDLHTVLSGHAGLAALVSARIYPNKLPQEVDYPAIVFQKISGDRISGLGGTHGLRNPRFQITCWSNDHTVLQNMATQLHDAMNTASQFKSTPLNEQSMHDPDFDLDGESHDFSIWAE